MIKGVIFDMFETLVTHYDGKELYFSEEMAQDAGLELYKFKNIWDKTKINRTIGKMSLEDVIELILKKNRIYSKELFNKIVRKRRVFSHMTCSNIDDSIINVLMCIKKAGLKIGLISNCFSEEAEFISKSSIYPLFDDVRLSYYEGLEKPNKDIFKRCLQNLTLDSRECIFIGDGGSHELETANSMNFYVAQACWFFKECDLKFNHNYINLRNPNEVLNMIK